MLKCDKIVVVQVVEETGDTRLELGYTLNGYEDTPGVEAMGVAIRDHLKKFIYLGEVAQKRNLPFPEFSVDELRDDLVKLVVTQMMVDAHEMTYEDFSLWPKPCRRTMPSGPITVSPT